MSILSNILECELLGWSAASIPPAWYTCEPGRYPQVAEADRPVVGLIQPDIKNGPWIAGGAVLSWYNQIPLVEQDIDVWFRDRDQLASVRERLLEAKASLIFQSENAETYQLYAQASSDSVVSFKVQLIVREFFDSAEEIIDLFDFSVCQMVTDGSVTVVGEHTAEDVANKKLRLLKERPDMLKRIVKYIAYGYSYPPGELLKYIETQFDFSSTNEEYDVIFLKGNNNGT